jgi:hypothetical protein
VYKYKYKYLSKYAPTMGEHFSGGKEQSRLYSGSNSIWMRQKVSPYYKFYFENNSGLYVRFVIRYSDGGFRLIDIPYRGKPQYACDIPHSKTVTEVEAFGTLTTLPEPDFHSIGPKDIAPSPTVSKCYEVVGEFFYRKMNITSGCDICPNPWL